ncbi:valine--tRNA ligase [Metamycoplasma canadense]|uniref:Valine--tRNA ligase n=1 Tax=Metamycoplasma canadense TaxID=29554 RepID=A0A077L6M2_9BACT|nr:valine--tRNA ligase [Metamycoplasma canadense]BAP39622.1 fusion of oligopeptide transport protein OppF and Valyl-tRNA synthetase [Metamycoplasma canadense]
MNKKKIIGLRILELEKRVKFKKNKSSFFKTLIHNLNLNLSKNSILGIFGNNLETQDTIFNLLVDKDKKNTKFKGFIEFQTDDNKFHLIHNNSEYQKNLSYGFNDDNLFDTKTKETLFSYLENYIKESKLAESLVNVFNQSWLDVYQDSKYHLRLEYTKINISMQKEIKPFVVELNSILDKIGSEVIKKLDYNDQILLMQNIFYLIKKIVKIIQSKEQEFFIYLENIIKNYENGITLMKYKEYKDAKNKYFEIYNKRYLINSKSKTFFLKRLFLKNFKIFKIKNDKRNEIKKYFSKLKYGFFQETKFNKFYLGKNLKQDSFLHYYSRYYINKIYYSFFKKYISKIQNLSHITFIEFIKETYSLRDSVISEINSIGSFETKKELKKRIQYISNKMLENSSKRYFERFKLLKNEQDESITQEFNLNFDDQNIKPENYINLSQIKQYEYEFIEKQADYYWNIENEGKKIKQQIKELYSENSKNILEKDNILKFISNKISELLNEISILNSEETEIDFKLLISKPIWKIFYSLKEINNLVVNLFDQFNGYKKVLENFKKSEKEIIKLILKSTIYKILANSNISLDKLSMNLSYLTLDEKITLEFNKILINNPSLIIIGTKIQTLKENVQIDIINKLNSFVLDNEALAIYFLNNIKILKNLTTELCILNNSKVIEQGKTTKILDNPINPFVKKILISDSEKISDFKQDFIEKTDDYENIFKYEIEPDHYIWCKWNQLIEWISKDNIQNQKFRDLLFLNSENDYLEKDIIDKRDYDDKTIIDFSNLNVNIGGKMDKNFDHKLVENGRNKKWIDMKIFSTHDLNKEPFTVILPPPNVTGKLHIGHALDNYIPDTIIRYKKLKGYDVMWVPGKDHAGIATQAVVEKKIALQNKNKYDLGREAFVNEIWKWKDEYSNNIDKQWGKLGLALDYTMERFTLDKDANEAVLKVFVEMYKKGLIYRDTKAIIWDTKLKTALSNIEVIPTEIKQKMYYIKYPIKGMNNEFLVVATTRVETMFSDVALALNTFDSRLKQLKNLTIIHPLTKKEIPIISSSSIDLNFGTGVMKVSAHAIDDIDIIKKNNLEIIECIDDEGKMNFLAGKYHNLDRFEARIKIAHELEENGFIEKIEDVVSNVGYSDRSKQPIEILVKPQWFVKMKNLSEKLLKNLDSSEGVKFIPQRFKDNLVKWMENVHDWTISRQIWWGHRIPAWYKNNEILVQIEKPGEDWIQDSDVLDTWFSSALSPFVFLGWPQKDEKIKRYYPTNLLVTGYDIIFFWVSRMYFQGLEFMEEIPFKEVLLHGLVRDSQGRKMSKSLGNGIDPIAVIDQYGSDVLRMALIFNCTPGLDINFGDEKIQSARLFINKVWNIARLIKNIPVNINEKLNQSKIDNFDKWILFEFNKMNKNIDDAMKNYEFTVIYKHIQDFIINKFSSWYLEFLKFKNNNYFIHYLFRAILIALHPYMPFLTDYLFEEIYKEELLQNESIFYNLDDEINIKETDNLIELITLLRKYREDKQISKAETLNYFVENNELEPIKQLIIFKLSNFTLTQNNDLSFQTSFAKVFIKQSIKDKENEIIILEKEIEKTKKEIEFNEQFIKNPKFMKNATSEKIKEKQDKLAMHKKNLAIYLTELEIKKSK